MKTDTPTPQPCCSAKVITFCVITLAVAVGLGSAWVWTEYLQTYHLATVQEGVLYRDGNRGLREFQTAVRNIKPKTVVSLIDDNELADPHKPMFAEEIEWCRQHGVNVVRIPVKLGGWPTTEDVRTFLDVLQDKNNQPVLVHCAQGVRRTGMFVAAYQESVLGWDDAKVKSNLLTFGHSKRTVKDVERFVDVYNAKDKTVAAQLEASSEE
jgi:protein tyrosine/serine phosphatase